MIMSSIIQWTTVTKYVDIETGEVIPLSKKDEYLIIKKHKHADVKKERGTLTFTIECRRHPQQRINFGNEGTD